jgi:hypothetical protein
MRSNGFGGADQPAEQIDFAQRDGQAFAERGSGRDQSGGRRN